MILSLYHRIVNIAIPYINRAVTAAYQKGQYLSKYESKLSKTSQILAYNSSTSPIKALKNIEKRWRSAIDETAKHLLNIAVLDYDIRIVLQIPVHIDFQEREKPYLAGIFHLPFELGYHLLDAQKIVLDIVVFLVVIFRQQRR